MNALTRLRGLRALGAALGRRPPTAPGAPWAAAAEIAECDGLGAALWVALRGRHDLLPAEVRARLGSAHRQNVARNLRLRRQLRDAVATLNDAGIEPLLFKGALALADGTFADPGERFMSDLDVLVLPESLDRAAGALEAGGYEARPDAHHRHELPLVHPKHGSLLELHHALGEQAVAAALPVDQVWRASIETEVEGLRYRRIAPVDAAVHHVLHTQVQDLNHQTAGLPLRQLHTFAALVRGHRDGLDWHDVGRRLSAHDHGAAYRAYVDLAARVLGVPRPPGTRATMAARGHTLATIASFAVGGTPSRVVWNLHYALEADYLDRRYGHGGRRGRLALARARHLAAVGRAEGRAAFRLATGAPEPDRPGRAGAPAAAAPPRRG